MRKFLRIFVVLLMISLPCTARADKEFIQKIQETLRKVQEKARTYQEKVQEIKDEVKNQAEQAKGFASQAQQLANDTVAGVKDLQNGDVEGLKKAHKTLEGMPDPNPKKTNPAKGVETIEQQLVTKPGEGDDDKKFDEAQEKMQEVLRQSVAELYAAGFTTRTNMQKEKPRDVDMNDTGQMLQETNVKAIEIVNRLAQIYVLESLLENYQFTQSLRTVTAAMDEEAEEN